MNEGWTPITDYSHLEKNTKYLKKLETDMRLERQKFIQKQFLRILRSILPQKSCKH